MTDDQRRTTTRTATAADVGPLCDFGREVVPAHYAPLIGEAHARAQVRDWWNDEHLRAAVAAGRVTVATWADRIVGVAQIGPSGDDVAIYKLYVHPDARGAGVGPLLIDALLRQLPRGTSRLLVEHFAANTRAGEFYEREGFRAAEVRPHPSGDARLAIVWRVRDLVPGDTAPGR